MWIIGFIGHMLSLISITIGSVWIWFFYPIGIKGEEGKMTTLGKPFGPEEPYLSSFYAGTMAMKWLMWTFQPGLVFVFIVGACLGDAMAGIAFASKLIVWGICFYYLFVTEPSMFLWIEAAKDRAEKEASIGVTPFKTSAEPFRPSK